MRESHQGAFLRKELVAIMCVLVLALGVLLPGLSRQKKSAWREQCCKNLSQIGVGIKTWSLDAYDNYHMQRSAKQGGTRDAVSTGQTFRHFQWMSNELHTPNVVVCPADVRKPAKGFGSGFSNSNVSYFISVDANDNFPEMLLCGDRNITNGPLPPDRTLELTTNSVVGWTEKMHHFEGNVLLSDGSVQGFDTSRLRVAVRVAGVTNRLAMP